VQELDEDGSAKTVTSISNSIKLGSNISDAPRNCCTINQEMKSPFGSLNIEMISKTCTCKIAENTSLENRLSKKSCQSFISVNTLPGATTTWLYDTGAEMSVMVQREFRKIPIENRPKKVSDNENFKHFKGCTQCNRHI